MPQFPAVICQRFVRFKASPISNMISHFHTQLGSQRDTVTVMPMLTAGELERLTAALKSTAQAPRGVVDPIGTRKSPPLCVLLCGPCSPAADDVLFFFPSCVCVWGGGGRSCV